MERLKLKPAFVPVPLWKRSVCNVLGVKRKPWRTLRQEVIDAAGSMCEYCGESYEKGMICHEVWEYDDQSHIATLTAFALACRDCNFVLHAGLALEVGFRQEATGKGSTAERGNQAVSHLSKVNSISESEAERILTLAFRQHSGRSRHRWEIRIASEMAEKYPVLNGLQL